MFTDVLKPKHAKSSITFRHKFNIDVVLQLQLSWNRLSTHLTYVLHVITVSWLHTVIKCVSDMLLACVTGDIGVLNTICCQIRRPPSELGQKSDERKVYYILIRAVPFSNTRNTTVIKFQSCCW